jgi:hypothetical protein
MYLRSQPDRVQHNTALSPEGGAGEHLAAPPPIVATTYRPIGKGTLIGSVDLYVTKWRYQFYGALWHRKGEREWVSFPAREWTDPNGERKFSPLGKFRNHGDARRFSEAAIAAIRLIAGGAP